MSVVFSYIVPTIVCVCVKQWEILEVDCKVRGASIRCGLEAEDGRQYWVGMVVFSTIKQKETKQIIPLLYHCLIGQ